jgi:branched-chain amino acid transport system permease protein
MLALSLDVLAGQSGMLSVAQAAFFGLGSYSSALLTLTFGVPFLVALGCSVVFTAVTSLSVSLPTLKLRGDSFVVATFALQMVLFGLFNNMTDVTRGPLGLAGIPRPTIFGWTVSTLFDYALLSASMFAIAFFVVSKLANSPFGRVLRAIREDESVAQALGKDIRYFKIAATSMSAVVAGSAGSLYAHFTTFVDPSSFTVLESVLILAMVIVGGAGSRWGPLVGAAVLVGIPELLRFVGLPVSVAANLRQILYGSSLILMMMIRPRGLLEGYGFGR